MKLQTGASYKGAGVWGPENNVYICGSIRLPGLARVGQIKFDFFHGFWPNLGPGHRPLDSVRRDEEFAGVVCVRSIFDGQFRAHIQILKSGRKK